LQDQLALINAAKLQSLQSFGLKFTINSAEHVTASFPNECEDLEIAGVDLEELSGTILGCIAPRVGRVVSSECFAVAVRDSNPFCPDSLVILESTTHD